MAWRQFASAAHFCLPAGDARDDPCIARAWLGTLSSLSPWRWAGLSCRTSSWLGLAWPGLAWL